MMWKRACRHVRVSVFDHVGGLCSEALGNTRPAHGPTCLLHPLRTTPSTSSPRRALSGRRAPLAQPPPRPPRMALNMAAAAMSTNRCLARSPRAPRPAAALPAPARLPNLALRTTRANGHCSRARQGGGSSGNWPRGARSRHQPPAPACFALWTAPSLSSAHREKPSPGSSPPLQEYPR